MVSTDRGPVVIFDGECGLCAASVRFILPRDRTGAIRFAAAQGTAGREIQAEAGVAALEEGTLLVVLGDRVLTRSDGALEIARHLRWPWRWLTLGRLVPRPLRDGLYRWVAARRRRFFGGEDACLLPREAWRDRFLE